MSTHQMHQVEEMCQRIMLINHGEQVLYGSLNDIRRRFSANAVEVTLRGDLDGMSVPGVRHVTRQDGNYRLLLEDNTQPENVLQTLVQMPEVTVERFERVETSLNEIFVKVVGRTVSEEGEQA
jgi:ABC-2 type transport system ATP-binding protein